MSTRTKWHSIPPPPPSPKILHFPRRRRTRRKHTTHNPSLLLRHQNNLDTLFDQEPPKTMVERRERVEEVEREDCNGGGFAEEKWRFQAEILRAECNLLRMEREFALKKLEKKRLKMETTLKSALHTLLSGREKICEGKNVNAVLEEEIDGLADKLEELQKTSIIKVGKKCSNFDKQASLLQRRLEKVNCTQDLEENVEEEYNSIVSNSSVASSASTSKRIEFSCFNSTTQLYQNKCSGRCKAIVGKIVEQVRAETEQWSQMQEMLAQVRREMEELQASRDYWENRARKSDCESQSLKHAVQEWKEKALDYEIKTNELQLQVSLLKEKMQQARVDLPLAAQLVKERLGLKKNNLENVQEERNGQEILKPNEDLPQPISLGKQLAKEKRMLLRHLKENRLSEDGTVKTCSNSALGSKRSSLRDIGNMLNHNRGVDFYSLESFRK